MRVTDPVDDGLTVVNAPTMWTKLFWTTTSLAAAPRFGFQALTSAAVLAQVAASTTAAARFRTMSDVP